MHTGAKKKHVASDRARRENVLGHILYPALNCEKNVKGLRDYESEFGEDLQSQGD